jgi:uncharacterized membrane protein YkoI
MFVSGSPFRLQASAYEIGEQPVKATLIATMIGVMLLGAAALAPAAADDENIFIMQAAAKTLGLIAPEQAKERALAAKAGTVTDTELEQTLSNPYYEIEIVDAEGLEWNVDVDAKTGQVKRINPDSD